ncbi:radical SAM protein [Pelagibius litoralis]|uniref:Radical SAM protein n=1 Tax=Pelagibius litoralis TaxID=374515 RepID=A0A967EX15_9PROT|nr:radical SAM protein [Pelagibius litoralis]NIA67190.1 radical SAM protein [Pelagibius litoralis]
MSEIANTGRARQRPAGKVVFAQVEPTTRCNFICGFCSGRQMDQTDFAAEDFQRLLDSFPDLEHIELQGEGEPLLHKGFFDMARQARERGIHLSMITNGSLLSEERVAAILDVGIEAIYVSIESPEEAAFQDIRGGLLSKVKAGIARLIAARKARGMMRPTVGFAITVLKDTIDSLPEIADLYRELAMDGGATVQALNRMESYTGVYDEAMAERLLAREDNIRMQQLIRGTPKIGAMLAETRNTRHFYIEMGRTFPAEHGCPWVKGALYVDRHGGIASCCMVKDTAKYGLGKIGLTPIEAVLDKRREIDEALQAGNPPEQCQGCGYYRSPERRAAMRLNRLAAEKARA